MIVSQTSQVSQSTKKWFKYIISTIIFSCSIFLMKMVDNFSVAKGIEPESSYVITMDNTTGWPDYSGSGYTTGSKTYRYVIMNFSRYLVTSSNGMQIEKTGGKIANNSTTPITGLQSITLTYNSDADILVYYGDSSNPSTNYKTCANGVTVDFSDVSAPFININSKNKYAVLSSVVITYTCTDNPGTPTIPVTEVSLSGTAALQVDGTSQLSASIAPENATDKNLTWTSSQTSVAEVSTTGLVTGIAAGSSTIRATNAASGVYGELVVTVATDSGGSGVATWERINAVSDLVAGDMYAFVYMTESVGKIASNTTSDGNNYLAENTFASNRTSVEAAAYSSSVYGWELGGSTGAWTFNNGSGYLYSAAAKSINVSPTLAVRTWSITISGTGYSTITNTTTANGSLQYNISSPRFNTYTSTQASIYLYRYVDGGPRPTTITVTDNSDYKVTETFDYNDFTVDITYSDETTLANVSYDATGSDGFYFGQAYDPSDVAFDKANPFSVGGEYSIEIYYGDVNGTCNDILVFNVKGGSELSDTLIDLEASDGAVSYSIGSIYTSVHQLTVTATWATYGTEIITSGDGTDGYALACTSHDLTTAFTEGGTYSIVVSYRSMSVNVSVTVIEGYEQQVLNYNYENLQDRSVYYVDAMPSTGTPKILVIPTKFTDTSLNTTQLASYKTKIEKAYFGTDADTGWKSVKTYFEDSSYGDLSISGKVTDWWNSGYSSSQASDETVTTTLVKNAVAWYKANNSDIADYDTNNDGYIDAVSLIYGAPNYSNSGSSNDNLWAYCYWVQDPAQANVSNPGPNVYFWASYDFMDEDTDHAAIDTHTYIHEMGHILGLDDYYNYDSTSSDGAAGGFLMQDYNVGDHDPYSKMAFGWIDPLVPTASTAITLRPFESSGDVIVLMPSFHSSPFDEYLVIDFYTATGLNYFDSHYQYGTSYPMGTTTKGIRVWHVDGRLFQTNTRTTSYTTSTTLATSVTSSYYYTHAMSNSTGATYGSVVSTYRNYRLLHLLQAGGTNTFKTGSTFGTSDLWTAGSSFSMATYSGFFYNSGKLNSNLNLGWSFTVSSLSDSQATIQITKL